MEHVAKWAVVVVSSLAIMTTMATAVTRAAEATAAGRNKDESIGLVLLGTISYLVTLIAVLVWWQPE